MRSSAKMMGACVIALCVGACDAKDPPVRRYAMRGLVTEVARAGAELSVTIHHERILRFEDRDGKIGEMPAMKMNFGVDSTVNAGLLRRGQKVAGEFDVRWNKAPALLLVRADALPEDTALVLGDAH